MYNDVFIGKRKKTIFTSTHINDVRFDKFSIAQNSLEYWYRLYGTNIIVQKEHKIGIAIAKKIDVIRAAETCSSIKTGKKKILVKKFWNWLFYISVKEFNQKSFEAFLLSVKKEHYEKGQRDKMNEISSAMSITKQFSG